MIFKIALYFSLGIASLGFLIRISKWFSLQLGIEAEGVSVAARITSATAGIYGIFFSKKLFTLLRTLLFDVFLQKRLFRASCYRWLSHMLVFWGFTLLLFTHALEALIMKPLIVDYASTQNPYLFLRNLEAFAVLAGLTMMIIRRRNPSEAPVKRNLADKALLIILMAMLMSGLFLEGAKITSETRFDQMVTQYSDEDDPDSIKALEYYWTKDYGLVSKRSFGGNPAELIARGKEIHETSCASCHARPQWAFISYGVAKGISPVARQLDSAGSTTFLWLVHFLTVFAALALFPFTKLFHLIATPLALLSNSVMREQGSSPVNIATRQALELDACTHCGLCTQVCAVRMAYFDIPNANILPSEKIQHLKALGNQDKIGSTEIREITEGLYLCTNCYRCTEVCPSGINLQSLWFSVREAHLQNGYPELLTLTPFSFYRALKRDGLPQAKFNFPLSEVRKLLHNCFDSIGMPGEPIALKKLDLEKKKSLISSLRGQSFSLCYTCTTCTSSCPVAKAVDDARKDLGLVPHQIIRAVNLGVPEMALRSEMLWSCLGCYMCQDACPQGVRVADIISELRLLAAKHVKEYLYQAKEK